MLMRMRMQTLRPRLQMTLCIRQRDCPHCLASESISDGSESDGTVSESIRTGRLRNSRLRQSCLPEEIWCPFVGVVAFGPPHLNRNPIHVADNRVMQEASQQCPESHFIGASHLQKTFGGHLSCRSNDSAVISACISENAGLFDCLL